MRGMVPKGSGRIRLLQDTLLRARVPALPILCSPFHQKRMIFALPCHLPTTYTIKVILIYIPDETRAAG